MSFLQSQAREKLEQLRIANEAEVRKELEATIDDLKVSVVALFVCVYVHRRTRENDAEQGIRMWSA